MPEFRHAQWFAAEANYWRAVAEGQNALLEGVLEAHKQAIDRLLDQMNGER